MFLTILTLISILLCGSGCEKSVNPLVVNEGEFSVHFLDVGQGDCILIYLPDGKNMLIDSGDRNEVVSAYVISSIEKTNKSHIDYLVVTHPDSDHVGNMKDIVQRFTIGTAFISDIRIPERFKAFNEVLLLLEEQGCDIKTSGYWQSVKTEDYFIAFLSPAPMGEENSSYDDINALTFPSDDAINNVSPIMYLECHGKRFVFTGDAGQSQERLVLNNYSVGIYDVMYGENSVRLENTHVLKVAHHGASDSSCQEFLNLLRPEYAVVSVGRNNHGHPSSSVLERIVISNPDVKLLRTDVLSTISIRMGTDFSLKYNNYF